MDKKYLKRQDSGLWLYRRKTPVLLKDKYKSSYIQHSLNTHSYHEAILKRNAINAEIDMQLAHVKRGDSDKAKFFHYYTPWRKERVEREGEKVEGAAPAAAPAASAEPGLVQMTMVHKPSAL